LSPNTFYFYFVYISAIKIYDYAQCAMNILVDCLVHPPLDFLLLWREHPVMRFGKQKYKHLMDKSCQIFLELTYQNGNNIPNDHKIFPNYHKMYQRFRFQGPPKFTQMKIFGIKICHLAILIWTRYWHFRNPSLCNGQIHIYTFITYTPWTRYVGMSTLLTLESHLMYTLLTLNAHNMYKCKCRGQCYDHYFRWFLPTFWQNEWLLYWKPILRSIFCIQIILFQVTNAFFLKFFGFLKHNIGPRTGVPIHVTVLVTE
jgi:hypothetical protein